MSSMIVIQLCYVCVKSRWLLAGGMLEQLCNECLNPFLIGVFLRVSEVILAHFLYYRRTSGPTSGIITGLPVGTSGLT